MESDGTSAFVVRTGPVRDLRAYASIPISFVVDEVMIPGATVSDPFEVAPADPVYTKNYDDEPGGHPSLWPLRFDTSGWSMISAWCGDERIGGLVLVMGDDAIDMLEGRDDLAIIWDLRVDPGHRGSGAGSALLEAAEALALERGCRELKVETQNINVPACRFYSARGFRLGQVDPDAYPDLPAEIQLLWYEELGPR